MTLFSYGAPTRSSQLGSSTPDPDPATQAELTEETQMKERAGKEAEHSEEKARKKAKKETIENTHIYTLITEVRER